MKPSGVCTAAQRRRLGLNETDENLALSGNSSGGANDSLMNHSSWERWERASDVSPI